MLECWKAKISIQIIPITRQQPLWTTWLWLVSILNQQTFSIHSVRLSAVAVAIFRQWRYSKQSASGCSPSFAEPLRSCTLLYGQDSSPSWTIHVSSHTKQPLQYSYSSCLAYNSPISIRWMGISLSLSLDSQFREWCGFDCLNINKNKTSQTRYVSIGRPCKCVTAFVAVRGIIVWPNSCSKRNTNELWARRGCLRCFCCCWVAMQAAFAQFVVNIEPTALLDWCLVWLCIIIGIETSEGKREGNELEQRRLDEPYQPNISEYGFQCDIGCRRSARAEFAASQAFHLARPFLVHSCVSRTIVCVYLRTGWVTRIFYIWSHSLFRQTR